ncbi:MAG TPA: hypothetical protein VGM19_12865 [Armatimonadota bacterium]|jgi:hypothetical protein
MKHVAWLWAVVAVLLIGAGATWAADPPSASSYSPRALEGPRAQIGWVWPGELTGDLVVGASYIWQRALLDVSYFRSSTNSASENIDAKAFSVEGSYLWRQVGDPRVYYGGGVGVVSLASDRTPTGGPQTSETAQGVLWNVVVGKEVSTGPSGRGAYFVEGRWDFGPNLSFGPARTGSINGARLSVGYRF